MVNCYAGYTESERRGTSPLPPSKGGKSESEGGMLSLQRGNAVRSAISKQRVVCRVGANLSVRPFFVWCRQYPNANFVNGRKSTQITVFVIPNTVRNLAGEREEILRFALNDKLMVNGQLLIVMPCRGEPSVRPFFLCGVGFVRTQISQMARIKANIPLCHSERLLLSFRTQ